MIIEGHHLLNSAIQFDSVDLGAMTTCGPGTSRIRIMYASSAIVWRVFPRPYRTEEEEGRVKGGSQKQHPCFAVGLEILHAHVDNCLCNVMFLGSFFPLTISSARMPLIPFS